MQPSKRTLEHCVSSEPPAKCLKHADAEIKEDDPRSEGEEVVDVVVPEDDQSCLSQHQLKSEPCKVVETKENNSSSQEHSGLDVQEYEQFQEGDREECASSPLKYWDAVLPPVHRRTVNIGPDHQADIPPWNPTSKKDDRDEEARWSSGKIRPRYDEEVVAVEKGRELLCRCDESGSIDCVRLHIEESRKTLAGQLGPAFHKLGFDDMGECVASHWTEDEENTFREVVRLNPASQKRDFWTLLPSALPNKSRKELVSYYFNVFMLRRRALQNRLTPRHCDSDDDETEPTGYEDESEWEYPEIEDDWRQQRVHEHSDCDSDAAPEVDVKEEYVASEEREEGHEEEEEEEEHEDEAEEEQEDEFHKENSAGTEAEIKRLATLGGTDAWLPSSSPLELASTNGAMQEFFGEPSY